MANHSQNLQVRVLEPSLSHPFVPSMSFWFHPAVFVRAVPSSISPQKRYAVFPRHRNGWGALLPVLLSNDGSLLCVEGGMIQINSSLIPCGYMLLQSPPLCHLLGAHHFTDLCTFGSSWPVWWDTRCPTWCRAPFRITQKWSCRS
jgi:hypothetical protein